MRIPSFALLLLAASSSVADAQPAAPDRVRLVDGQIVDGTIVELVPGSHLRLRLPTLEERRVPIDRVAWAGPVEEWRDAADPPRSERLSSPAQRPYAAARPPSPDDARVEVDREGTHLLTRRAAGWELVCEAPCAFAAPPGARGWAVSDGAAGRARPLGDSPFELRPEQTLAVRWDDRSSVRIAGWVTVATIVLGGLTAGIGGTIALTNHGNTTEELITLTAGFAGAGLGFAIGMPLAMMRDRVAHEIR